MLNFRQHKKSIIIAVALILIIIIINISVSLLIKKKITDALSNRGTENYIVNIENVKFRIFSRSIVLENISFMPTEELLSKLKDNNFEKGFLQKFHVKSIKLQGIGLIKALFSNNIYVSLLDVNGLVIEKITNPKKKVEQNTPNKSFDIDSIYLEKINGFEINKIHFSEFQYQISDIISNEITFQTDPISLKSNGFMLESVATHLFKLKLIDDTFELNNITIDFSDQNYQLGIEQIDADFEKKVLEIKNFSLKPTLDKRELALSYKYTNEVYDVSIGNLTAHNFDITKVLKNEGIYVDSVEIIDADVHIYKDKNRPFDLLKRPVLINDKLREMENPLYIQKIKLDNSNLKYEERQEKRDLLMTVSLNKIKARINNVTSIEEYRELPLTVILDCYLMNKAKMRINANFPLKDNQKSFSFDGKLGASKFKDYESALYPALGIQIMKGNIDDLSFNASATNISSHGRMTLLYHDLEAKVLKSEKKDKSKFMSWGVNSVVHNANPGKNNKTREVLMSFDRVEYKGLGNYLWKTVMSGLVNTISPVGKKSEESKEQQKIDKKKARIEQRENRKNN